jgi:glycosyltransferase involved in cell wall biosynthesis
MLAAVKRYAITTEDWLRYSPLVRGVLSRYLMLRDASPDPLDQQLVARSIVKLCAAVRLQTEDKALLRIEERLRDRLRLLDPLRLDWKEFVPDIDDPRVSKGIVLKPWVGPREKGVVLIAFEDNWVKLLRHANLKAFAERYTLVVSPTWSPPHSLIACGFPRAYPGPIFVTLSHENDRHILPRLAPNYVPLPLYASSWINPARYRPLPRTQRDIDLIMVANFGKFKRHHLLFRAIARMPRSLRILLIGQNHDGRTIDTIRAEARCFGVAGRFEARSDLPNEGVALVLARSRVSIVLSRREGACLVVAESLFAGTPVGLLHDAGIGSRAFVNAQTGRFLFERNLGAQLTDFIGHSDDYAPRCWAEEHIACDRSSAVLNAVLKEHALKAGEEWVQDIAPMYRAPDPRLLNPEDRQRLRPAVRELRERFGLVIGAGADDSA